MLKSTGIVRKIDELGRIVLPIELRRKFKIELGDALQIDVDGERIVLRKYEHDSVCVFCGSTERVIALYNKSVCPDCLELLQDRATG